MIRSMGPRFEEDLVARSAAEYVEKALRAGTDKKWQLDFSARMAKKTAVEMLGRRKNSSLAWGSFIARAVRLHRMEALLGAGQREGDDEE